MTILTATGTRLTESALNALTANPPGTAPVMRLITQDIVQRFSYEYTGGFEAGERLLFHAGQVVSQAEIDALYLDATITGVTPATGPAAGGTDVTIRGTNFAGAAGVTVGGAAATQVRVVSDTVITARTPAGTAGARDVVVADDAGNVTRTGGFTYA